MRTQEAAQGEAGRRGLRASGRGITWSYSGPASGLQRTLKQPQTSLICWGMRQLFQLWPTLNLADSPRGVRLWWVADALDGARLTIALAGRGVAGASFLAVEVEGGARSRLPALILAHHRTWWSGVATGSECCEEVKYLAGGALREVWPGGGGKVRVTLVAGAATLRPLTEVLRSLRTCGEVLCTVRRAGTA
jgi:hypothetical protein